MDINFEYYKIFYYVAKYGNLTKAARALGNSQPNVTRIMKLLETQLRCKLFVREARGISLTEEGKRLYAHAEIACRHLLNAQEELCGQDPKACGTVEIGATETALYLVLLDALYDFKIKYPSIRLKIHNHTTPETVKHLTSGRLDFAVITAPFDAPKSVLCETILEFEEILVGGTEYRHLCDAPLTLKETLSCPWIGLGRGSVTYDLYKNFFIQQGIDMDLDMEVAPFNLMLSLIKNNLGIGFVPEQLARPLLEEKKLVRIPVEAALPKRSIQIVSDKGRGKSFAADIFYRYLKQEALQ